MASIIKRGLTWRAMIVRKGQRVSATFDSYSKAEAWSVQAEAAILAGAKPLALRPIGERQTVADLFDRYATEVSPRKKGCRWERIRLGAMRREVAFNTPVGEFDAVALAGWRDARLTKVSPLTVNRELNLISGVMQMAIKEWRAPIPVNPVHQIKRPPNPRARKRRVSVVERVLIAKHLGWDMVSAPDGTGPWTAFAFFLALETAMRKGEILKLRHRDLLLEKSYARLTDTKNTDDRDVPLSPGAMALLRMLPEKPGAEFVVPLASGTLDMTFRRAKLAAGLGDLRFHDSRREAATMLSKKLSNVLELAAVTGHRSLNVLRDYYRPDPSDLAKKLV